MIKEHDVKIQINNFEVQECILRIFYNVKNLCKGGYRDEYGEYVIPEIQDIEIIRSYLEIDLPDGRYDLHCKNSIYIKKQEFKVEYYDKVKNGKVEVHLA